jgi:hypothetical protein
MCFFFQVFDIRQSEEHLQEQGATVRAEAVALAAAMTGTALGLASLGWDTSAAGERYKGKNI